MRPSNSLPHDRWLRCSSYSSGSTSPSAWRSARMSRAVLGRTVLRPLSSTSRAVRQIAVGNLEIELTPSRVREVAEVGTPFEAIMGRDPFLRQAKCPGSFLTTWCW